MALPPPEMYNPSEHHDTLHQMAQIHIDCITHDGTLATFLPPLDHSKILNYWRERSKQVEQGSRDIFLQFAPSPTDGKVQEVAGVVTLDMPFSETGPFRCEAEKLLVSPRHRRQGIARRLMEKLEEVAGEKERCLIYLSTTVGTEADDMYPKLGYTCYGVCRNYGIDPRNGRLVDGRFFYKDLRDHAPKSHVKNV